MYYFHLVQHGSTTVDSEGRQLPNDAAAFQTAITAARSIKAADVVEGVFDLDASIMITDPDGISTSLPFACAVTQTKHTRPVRDLSEEV